MNKPIKQRITAQKNGDYWQITYPKKAIKK